LVNNADKQAISTVIVSSNYFQAEGTSPSPSVIEKQLAELDLLVESLEPEDVRDLKEKVEKAGAGQGAKTELVNKAKTLPDGKFTEFA